MAEDQAGSDCVANGPDPDLQRAPIGNEPGDLQADCMIGRGHGLTRRCEERPVRPLQHVICHALGIGGITIHEWQIFVHLHHQQRVDQPLLARLQEVGRQVRIAAQRNCRAVTFPAAGNDLRQHVGFAVEDCPQGVGVICRDIVLLRPRRGQPAAGKEEELDDLDIGRQGALVQRARIGKVRVAAEQPVDHRGDELPLYGVGRRWFFQRQGRQDSQRDRLVRHGAGHQRVAGQIGLPKAQGHGEHDCAACLADDLVGEAVGVGVMLGHLTRTRLMAERCIVLPQTAPHLIACGSGGACRVGPTC